MRRSILPTALLLALSGCFSPSRATAPGTDTTGSEGGTGDDASASASASISSHTGLDTTASTTADASDSTVSTTAPDGSTGPTELGPRIVMSVPSDGDTTAPLNGYFLLYFDRVVSTNDAVGHIFVSQNGSEPQPISPMACPPDADPTCIAGVFPEAFVDPDTNDLPSGAMHTITVEADFPDPDGMVNTMDQTVEFTTFTYEPNFFDDSGAVVQEFGGIAYDSGSESLFIVGVPATFGDECVVRRIPIPGGTPGAASTAATPSMSYLCYGIDAIGGELFVSGSYTDNVFRYQNLANATLDATETIIANPTLPPPLADLSEVWSVARGGNSTFFAHGEFTGGTEDTSILQLTDGGVWSEFESGENLWDNADGVVIEGATFEGVDHLMVGAEETLRKFRISDGTIISEFEFPLGYQYDLQMDSHGRLWVGSDDGITVLDASDDSYTQLAARPGLSASRIALREDGDTVHVYYQRFREDGVIGHVSIDL